MIQRLAFSLLPLSITLAACASHNGFQPSRHYAEVTKHLDLGGDVLLYTDVDGDLSAGAATLDTLLGRMGKSHPDLKLERINAKRLLNLLGLDQIVAFGLSSARDGKAFHNKAFLEYGKERRGLLLLTGSAPRELELPLQAPADVDVAFESELKVKSLLNLVEAIATDIAGKEAKALFASLDEKLPATSLSLRDLLGRLDTRLVGVLRVDEQRAFTLPNAKKLTVPGFDLLLSVDDLGILFDAYKGLLKGLPNVTSTLEGDMYWLEIEVALPGATWLKPVLAKSMKTGRVFLASSKAFVKEFLADKTGDKRALGRAADWKRATAGFEPKANALSYMSGAFMGKLARFLRPLGRDDKSAQMGIDILLDFLPEAGIPSAAQQVNLPDGLYYTSFATTSHKATLLPALAVGPVALAGVIASAATTALRRSLRRASQASALGVPSVDMGALDVPSDGAAADANEANSSPKPDLNQQVYKVPVGRAPGRGGAVPKVTIIEYADFQCPYCTRAHRTLQELAKTYDGAIRLYFKHLPMSFHNRAMASALAAEAAHEQGKFWPMHDKLLANQQKLSDADLEGYAKAIGLDMAKYKAALKNDARLRRRIEADQLEANQFGATGTPSFFINGQPLVGAQSIDIFKARIDGEIKKADAMLGQGKRRKNLYTEMTKGGLERKPSASAAAPDPDMFHQVEIKEAPVPGAKP
jgi:protein-disulfide isomerase